MQKNLINTFPDPIIVCGMHRSGTSLISKILSEMGVFMGSDVEVNHESLNFLLLNDQLLAHAHSFWDEIEGASSFFNNKEAMNQAVDLIKNQYLNKKFFKPYLGSKYVKTIPQKWGWKDPRNTITFPLWHSVFKNAKFLFIYRNGVDSIASLVNREHKQDFDITIPAYSSRCMNLDSAFGLWEDYNQFFFAHKHIIKNDNLLEIKYEDFLQEPNNYLSKIAHFVDIPEDTKVVKSICNKINSNRAYSFLDDKELIAFYTQVKDNKTMIQLGYNHLIDE
jgi:hypothetical protein